MAKIIPGILTANEDEYKDWLKKAERVSNLVQIDVIDGKFAKNTTIGAETIQKYPTSSDLEVQLMVISFFDYIKDLENVDYVSRIIIPFEVQQNRDEALYLVKKNNKQ